MPFLLHKDAVLTEETAASDYQKWLYDDDNIEPDGDESRSSRSELGKVPQQDNRRFEACG
ncbi:MAG: hypothetical protein ACO1TE_19000 [Prosthecobacter sp.]